MGVAQVPLSLYVRVYRDRVLTESWILEKVLKFSQQFSRPEKSLENKDKVWKNGKNSWVFFFQSYSKCFISEFFFFFVLVESYSTSPVRLHCVMKKSFVPAFFKVSINHLFHNLESGKRNYSFGKSLEKVLLFGFKNLYEPWKSTGHSD